MCRSGSNRNESKVKMAELCFPFGLARQPFDLSSRWAIIRPICRQIDCVSTEDIGFVLSPSRSSQSRSTKRLLSALALASILMFGLPNCSIANHCDWLLAIQVTCFLFLPIHAAAAEPPATSNQQQPSTAAAVAVASAASSSSLLATAVWQKIKTNNSNSSKLLGYRRANHVC